MSETKQVTEVPYKWTQTLAEANLTVPVAPGTRARDINCKITATHLTLGLKGHPPIIDVSTIHNDAVVFFFFCAVLA